MENVFTSKFPLVGMKTNKYDRAYLLIIPPILKTKMGLFAEWN